ncbi:MAG TPA: PmoA family protein [Bryobacteraceae bacterium]|nr:PmoA family protein [Bryobacteraceae bacterium]
MKRHGWWMALAAAACLPAQVRFDRDLISVNVDGKPFTVFHYGAESGKPYLAPLRSASGKIVTRRYPMETVAGESTDHLHHTGLWFSYDDVNGVKFWENDPSYKRPNMGRIVVRNAEYKEGDRAGTLSAIMEWRDPNGKVLLVEDRKMIFYSDSKLRTIDFEIALTAAADVTFGDTKEGAFAIRLADALTERKGGKMVNAQGGAGMAQVWGQRSDWVDYSGELDGEKLGVAIFDHPGNPRHPAYWHARDYGLFALNPFGVHAFDKGQPQSHWQLARGQQLVFRWRVVVHPGDVESGRVAELYQAYAGAAR